MYMWTPKYIARNSAMNVYLTIESCYETLLSTKSNTFKICNTYVNNKCKNFLMQCLQKR